MAAIGYCFGGTVALELARSGADLGAVVGFHSGLGTGRPAGSGEVKAGILVCIGAEDPMIPPAERVAFEEEMRAADVDWRMNLYGGAVHSFTNPNAGLSSFPGVAYHQPTDERSWRAMLDFFDERFGRPTAEPFGRRDQRPLSSSGDGPRRVGRHLPGSTARRRRSPGSHPASQESGSRAESRRATR